MPDDPKNGNSDDSEEGKVQHTEPQVQPMVPDLGDVIVEGAEPNRRKRLKESGDDN